MRFRSIFALAALVFAFAAFASAQDDYNRAEFFAGYTHNRVDVGLSDEFDDDDDFDDKLGTHGVNLQVTGNVQRYAGIKFDFAGQTKRESEAFDGGTLDSRYKLFTFMGGVQFKDNATDGPGVKPFAHILAGGANQSLDFTFTDPDGSDTARVSGTDFTMAFGGGLDVKLGKRVDLRVIQLDYNPIFRRTRDNPDFGEIPGGTQHNFRIGFGIVFH